MVQTRYCTTRQINFRGWDACSLENGYIRLVAVPDIGGRIMAYDLGPYPFLFVDPNLAGKLFTPQENQGDGSLAAWKNYGGDKTWPAPQGWDTDQQWHGPPDPILDTGRYTLNEMNSDGAKAVVRMTSPPDPRTGVQISRQLTIFKGSSRVVLNITFKNIKNTPIRWSIWDVVQLRAEKKDPDGNLTFDDGCIVTTPVNPNSKFANGYSVMFGAKDNPQWVVDDGLLVAPNLWQIGKIGMDSPGGWIAFANTTEGYAFVEQFETDPNGEYPDDGATVEVWTVGAGEVGNLDYEGTDIYLSETEVLSPMRIIQPGEETTFAITWGVCRCQGIVRGVTENGVIFAPMKADVQNEFTRITGQFGAFDTGELQLQLVDANGNLSCQKVLGEVDPLHVVNLDTMISCSPGAKRAQLVVVCDDATKLLAQVDVGV